MIKRKKGDFVKIKTAVLKNKEKVVFADYDGEHQVKEFQIVAVTKWHPELPNYYIILIDDDMIGWTLSIYHVNNNDIEEQYVGKKFYEISEEFIIK